MVEQIKHLLVKSITCLLAATSALVFANYAAPLASAAGEPEGYLTDGGMGISDTDAIHLPVSGDTPRNLTKATPAIPSIFTKWETIANPGNIECSSAFADEFSCVPPTNSCHEGSGASTDYRVSGDDVLTLTAGVKRSGRAPRKGSTVHGTQTNLADKSVKDLGWDCVRPGTPEADSPAAQIVITAEDFAELPVKAPIAHAGPERGWLPVNMVNVLYTDADTQELETEVLGTPVRIRATPVEFHWDLGHGNTITTTNPGKPFPSERVSSEYRFEGWYDITLTTTFTGQFSVDGGEWQDIEGSIEIESDPVELYAKSLESRLVNGSTTDEEDDEDEEEPWIPDRTPDTEGPIDPEARHRRI